MTSCMEKQGHKLVSISDKGLSQPVPGFNLMYTLEEKASLHLSLIRIVILCDTYNNAPG